MLSLYLPDLIMKNDYSMSGNHACVEIPFTPILYLAPDYGEGMPVRVI